MAEPDAGRNHALDLLRFTALVGMTCSHLWRPLLSWNGVEGGLEAAAELAPLFFFFAFGMTQSRLWRRPGPEIATLLFVFGVIGVLHGVYESLTPGWEFLLFLWSTSLMALAGARLGFRQSHFALLAAGILAVNSVFPLGVSGALLAYPQRFSQPALPAMRFAAHAWLLPGAFYPLPWAAAVFLGTALGVQFPPLLRDRRMLVLLALATLAAIASIVSQQPSVPIAIWWSVQKWSATSGYLLAGCGIALCAYACFDRIRQTALFSRHLQRIVRFGSDHLLEGTVLHYVVLRLLMDPRFGWPLVVDGERTASVALVVGLTFAALLLLYAAVWLLDGLWWRIGTRMGEERARATLAVAVASLGALWPLRACLARGVLAPASAQWILLVLLILLAFLYQHLPRRSRTA